MYPVPDAIMAAVAPLDPDGQFMGFVTFCFEIGEDLEGGTPEAVLADFLEQYEITGDPSYEKLANAAFGLALVTIAASVAGWHLNSEGAFTR